MLPEELQNAIEAEVETSNMQEIAIARETLTDRYRGARDKKGSLITTDVERLSYLATRMPATYAVVRRVLKELTPYISTPIKDLLDLGAGPGTAMWAAQDLFHELEAITLVEQDISLATIGKRLALKGPDVLKKACWHHQNMLNLENISSHDLIILSYSVGELAKENIAQLIRQCWNKTEKFLVVIEPGTTAGFNVIRDIRSELISLEAHLIAPCPSAGLCPMQDGNWCHFSERIERSFLHRKIKKGTLGYEDEKYSYLIAGKAAIAQESKGRIVRHPQKHSGHITFEVCADDELITKIVSKRTKEAYKVARKLEWGDILH